MRVKSGKAAAWLKVILALALIAWIIVWATHNKQRLLVAFEFHTTSFILLLVLATLSFVLLGYINQLFITHLGSRLNPKQWVSLSFASSLANLIFPLRAGAFFRARYLNTRFAFPYSSFISTQAVYTIINVIMNCLFGLISMIWIHTMGNETPGILIIFYISTLFTCTAVLVLAPSSALSHKKGPIVSFLWRIRDGWRQLHSNPSLMLKTASLTILLIGITTLRLYIAFRSIGHPLLPAGCMLAASLAGMSTILALTPSGLGIKEAAIIFIGMSLELPAEVSVLAAVMDRAVGIVVLFVFGSFGAMFLTKDKSNNNITSV